MTCRTATAVADLFVSICRYSTDVILAMTLLRVRFREL